MNKENVKIFVLNEIENEGYFVGNQDVDGKPQSEDNLYKVVNEVIKELLNSNVCKIRNCTGYAIEKA